MRFTMYFLFKTPPSAFLNVKNAFLFNVRELNRELWRVQIITEH